jgi:hypothetical protein
MEEIYGMMAQQQVRKPQAESCPMFGSHNIATTMVTYKDKRKEGVPVCQGCGHFMFAKTTYSYAFTVRGLAHDWARAEDLKGVIEDILRDHMPKDDVQGMDVNVQVIASYNGDQEILE